MQITQYVHQQPVSQTIIGTGTELPDNPQSVPSHQLQALDMRQADKTCLTQHSCQETAVKPEPQIEDSNLQVTLCSKPLIRDIDAAIEILKSTIPEKELGDTDILKGQIQNNEQQLILAKSGKGIVGTAIVRSLPEAESALINYLAVDKSCHSKGYGSRILKQLDNAFMQGDPNIKHLLLEIEPYDSKTDAHDNKVKRASFYHRAGYVKVDINYCGINRMNGKPIDYFLMHKPVRRAPVMPMNSPPLEPQTDLDLQKVLRSILTRNYQVKDQLGSLIGRILEPAGKAA